MNAPQFPIAVTNIPRARVQHGHVIVDQQIPLLPREPQTHAVVVYDVVHDLLQALLVVLDGHVTR